jgi:CRISPR-associated helicase Cas3/CRISPR-associated endonuclease Cas3-HD
MGEVMKWSPGARSVWGKLDPRGDGWMPLVVHLQDAAAVAGYLWDEFVPVATRGYICAELGIPAEQARMMVAWLAAVHDIAKVTPAFAAKAVIMPSVLDAMRDQGLDARPTPEDRYAPHATAGQVILEDWLARRCPESTKQIRNSYACVVGGHHGTTPSKSTLMQAESHPRQLGRGRWQEVRDEILDAMAVATGADPYLAGWLQRPVPVPVQMLLTGFVVMADWIASNADYFPYSGGESTDARLASAVTSLRLPPPWRPVAPAIGVTEMLASRFQALREHTARPLQESLVAEVRAVGRPSLFIVEGPMGVGKTEAALLAAEVLADRFGLGGVFVGLPTMATANPMFIRVSEWAKAARGEHEASIALVHGKAALNDQYSDLVRQSWRGQVYDEDGDADDRRRAAVVVNDWLRGRKRSGLADFVVGTIDQSLFAALKAKHVVLRHLGLAGKVVIIDEVHAADDYMREYLKRLLSWLGAYRAPVILMSATLPPAQRDELAGAYADGAAPGTVVATTSRDDRYPRLTVVASDVREVAVPGDDRDLAISVGTLPDELSDLATLLATALVDGGCAAVICNTVARAQDVHAALRDLFGDDVMLAHSRFIAPDRARREAELVRLLGREAPDRPERLVVVGTQVLEQSLDIDFDVMVTDLAPMDLLLQRAGRLHRHDRRHRPARVARPTLWLRGVDDWSAAPPIAVRGSRAVYGAHRLLRSASVLRGVGTLRLPSDIPRLVRLAYDPDAGIPAGWQDAWSAAKDREFSERTMAIARAQTYLLDPPSRRSTMSGLVDVDSGDPDKREEQGRSQVRDSDEGLEVMALWRGSDGLLRLPEGLARFGGCIVPEGQQWGPAEESLARAMATCTLRLPASLCYPRVVEQVIADLEKMADYSGWQSSHWIAGELVVVFDESGVCHVAGHRLSYDPDQGLRVTHPEEPRP